MHCGTMQAGDQSGLRRESTMDDPRSEDEGLIGRLQHVRDHPCC